jgi:hypothetical protein
MSLGPRWVQQQNECAGTSLLCIALHFTSHPINRVPHYHNQHPHHHHTSRPLQAVLSTYSFDSTMTLTLLQGCVTMLCLDVMKRLRCVRRRGISLCRQRFCQEFRAPTATPVTHVSGFPPLFPIPSSPPPPQIH